MASDTLGTALPHRFKLCAEGQPAAGLAMPPAKGLRTSLGGKRPCDASLMPPPADAKTARFAVTLSDEHVQPGAPGGLGGAELHQRGAAAAATAPAAGGGDAADVSGLDLLLFASEVRGCAVKVAFCTSSRHGVADSAVPQATPFKSALNARGNVPGVSPLGQLARLVDTSPFAMPGGAQLRTGGAHARPRPCKLGGVPGAVLSALPPSVLQPLSVNVGHTPNEALRTTAQLVAALAPTAACHAAERWLDILAADLRARHAALRKSRGRISRAHGALCECRSSGDTSQASLLLRQLDTALAGEEAALATRMKEVMDVRALCGVPEGELRIAGLKLKPSAPPPADSITAPQAAASAAAVIFTAAALSTDPRGYAQPLRASSGSEP